MFWAPTAWGCNSLVSFAVRVLAVLRMGAGSILGSVWWRPRPGRADSGAGRRGGTPDDVDDVLAITMGIAGTGAPLPLEQAAIEPGESVLILRRRTLGQIALQLARILGAGRVVGAARDTAALERLRARGLADAVVALGSDDDAVALKAVAGEGFDVVLDGVCGAPLLAALKATRWGARILTIGTGAGRDIHLNIADLFRRSAAWAPASVHRDRQATWRRLLQLAREHQITFDHVGYRFDQMPEAWAAIGGGASRQDHGLLSGLMNLLSGADTICSAWR